MSFFYFFTMTVFIAICVILILLILIQKGRGGGLSGAFGGGGGSSAFGTKTGDVLTWATSIVFGIFMILAVTLNLMADHMSQKTPKPPTVAVQQQQQPSGSQSPAPGNNTALPPVEAATPTTGPSTAPSK